MKFMRYQLCLGFLLNVVIHLYLVMGITDTEEDYLSQKNLKKLEKTLGKLAIKIQNNSCHPLPSSIRDCNTIDQEGSYIRENCQHEDKSCYSWKIAFISGGKKFMVFLGTNDSLNKKRDFKITCIETDSQDTAIENSSDQQELDAETDKTFVQCWKTHRAKIIEGCKKGLNFNPNCAQNIYISGNSPKFRGVGILVFTHLLVAAVGAGILYLVLKKLGRLMKTENKSEGNKGFYNASYSQQENTGRITIPRSSNDYDEELYHEVEGKTLTLPFENHTKSNSFTGIGLSQDRKLYKLPDIPREPEKDEYEYLISHIGKDGLQIDSNVNYTGLNPEDHKKASSAGDQVDTNHDILDNSPKVTFAIEDKTDEYFVLEKDNDMDLK
ncbi:uncharacterized protein LOC133188083 [Saccostrea echinata]|uniref:uncharacterized protein LOC133188083 n=1 Tax=Saccostrea echinata TaxID=191078 RepID=UPI002A83ACE7|nr:uncharacterized protein LOC133188083 [Saccostrea echinata]